MVSRLITETGRNYEGQKGWITAIINQLSTIHAEVISKDAFSFIVIDTSEGNLKQILDEIADSIHVQLYEQVLEQIETPIKIPLRIEYRESIPFTEPKDFTTWKTQDKLLLYGVSGS